MKDLTNPLWIKLKGILFLLIGIVAVILLVPAGPAWGAPGPQPYQCPESNAHVWDPDQCPRLRGAERFDLGGGGDRRGFLGRLLGGLTGGLL